MRIKDIFYKTDTQNVATVNVMQMLKRQSFIDNLLAKKQYDLAAYVAIQYFCSVVPVDDSISRIYKDVGAIPLLIKDVSEDEFVSKHPLQVLLDQPNYDDTQRQFMNAFCAYYTITGDSYIIANSIEPNSIPRHLFVIPPQSVQINYGTDNTILSYTVTQTATPIQYMPIQTLNGTRYSAKLANGTYSEIYHSLTFNPLASSYNIRGRAPMSSLYFEMEQFIAANTHNLSRLKRGTTLDGVFEHDDKLTDDQYQRLKAQIEEYWGGEQNSGKPFLAEDGLKFTANPGGKKDMDYSVMKRDLLDAIYNKFQIPLPMISKETMTMANMEAATIRFYDETVIPTLNMLLADLTKFLMPRYPNSENMIIWYDVDSIPALEPRRNEQLQAKQKLNIYTINELRAMDRAEAIDGGQNLYGNITQVPIAVDTEDEFATGDELERPQQQTPSQPTQDEAAKFRSILELYKDEKGMPMFTNEEIEQEVANL